MTPLAFHITWTTYGSWLHGDERNWVESGVPGIQVPDPQRKAATASLLAEEPVELTSEQRRIVEQTVRDHCRIRGWTLHAIHVGSVHVHVVVTADRRPEEVMNQLKAWCSRRLSDHAGLMDVVAKKAGRKRWFTEHGSTKWINEETYLQNAIRYVKEQQ